MRAIHRPFRVSTTAAVAQTTRKSHGWVAISLFPLSLQQSRQKNPTWVLSKHNFCSRLKFCQCERTLSGRGPPTMNSSQILITRDRQWRKKDSFSRGARRKKPHFLEDARVISLFSSCLKGGGGGGTFRGCLPGAIRVTRYDLFTYDKVSKNSGGGCASAL